ncbi:mannose-6-phosphate isomerase, type 1 [Cnuella takakiae]|uniref:mannose-6-phosphate isomerase n=1 Tax=Cnuella takakiae TaxID=1302690 RepID=A0A1M4YKB7_9BACT|nr:mannose-6-phosphate isomerase, class I [Cnuella takakiae]OLY94883.1 mannose-6-phosphate isomerase, class I [Cnuella takakiae]SHF05942.1 mannose-6-phosphate isomerase, type 1 [Cnuella takakiae]
MHPLQGIFPLKGIVQHYSWGGFSYIPQLLQQPNADQQPCAEYWLGAHPNHPAQVSVNGNQYALNKFIEQYQGTVLGQQAFADFGRLPYLLKVLDVRQMLSIQVHPDIPSAQEGFARENAAGIPANAAHRNYKDDNHKPELMVALSDFWLLHGFKSPALLREVLESVPEFEFLVAEFDQNGYEGLYRKVMTLPQEEVNAILQPVVDRVLPLYHNGELLKKQEDFWTARAAETYCKDGNIDRGIFSIYLFNLVHLRKGEGIFQQARLPHAYLEGQNVELMANSDNVLRAGLTDKHIDVAELLKHVRYEETIPMVLGAHASEEEEIQFSVPAPEFELYQYQLEGNPVAATATSAEILLVLHGRATVKAGDTELDIPQGSAALVSAGTHYTLQGASATELFRAAVPQKQVSAQ